MSNLIPIATTFFTEKRNPNGSLRYEKKHLVFSLFDKKRYGSGDYTTAELIGDYLKKNNIGNFYAVATEEVYYKQFYCELLGRTVTFKQAIDDENSGYTDFDGSMIWHPFLTNNIIHDFANPFWDVLYNLKKQVDCPIEFINKKSFNAIVEQRYKNMVKHEEYMQANIPFISAKNNYKEKLLKKGSLVLDSDYEVSLS